MMRGRWFVLAAVVFMTVSVSAADSPVDAGSMVLSGTAFYQNQSGDLYENYRGDDLQTITVAPGFGYFVSPGVFLGGELAVVSISRGGSSLTNAYIVPQLGYYFNSATTGADVKGRAYPYAKAIVGIGTISNGDSETQTLVGAKLGSVFMLSNTIAADVGLQVQREFISDYSGTTIWIGVGITAFLWD